MARIIHAMFGWDSRAAKVAWTVGLVALAFYAAYVIRKTLLIFVLALFLAYMIAPLVSMIERYRWRRIPRGASVLAAISLVVAVLGLGVALVAPLISEEAQKLADQLPKLTEKTTLVEKIPLPGWLEQFRGRLGAFVQENIKAAATAAIPLAKDVGSRIFVVAGNAVFVVLIPILALIFLKDGPQIRETFLQKTPRASRGKLSRILSDLHDALGTYVRALGLLSLATLAAYGLFFGVAGVPYGILLAAIAAPLEIIPLLGPLAAAVIALFVAGISGYDHLLWMVGFFLVYRVFQDYVLSPYLMSGGIGVHPALVIFGLLAGEQLGGVAGIFLSIPAIAALIILEKHIRAKEVDGPVTAQASNLRPPAS
jgi:predicted PurR-regulated permease PerM